jgi:hypothetical protein
MFRRKAKAQPPGGVVEPSVEPILERLRAGNADVPFPLRFRVRRTVVIDDVTAPGEHIHLLCDVAERSGRYRDGLLVAAADGRADILILAASDGRVGQSTLFTQDGGTSEHGPVPGWTGDAGWDDLSLAMARHMLELRNDFRAGRVDDSRQRLRQHPGLQGYKARTGSNIGIHRWRVRSTQDFPAAPGARLELWSAVVADGPITYQLVGAGFRPDGSLVALATLEGMPSTHDQQFLCVFDPEGRHINLGQVPVLQMEPRDFAERATGLLAPFVS